MGFLPVCNSTLENAIITEVPIWRDYTFHRIGLFLSAIFGLVAILVSLGLIYMHATHYLKPYQQRHIIRILFMVPVYAMVSFLSYWQYTHSIYYEVIRDCYEAFAIASFFSLLCNYIAPDLHSQKDYFRKLSPIRSWVWPIPMLAKFWGGKNGRWRTPRSGLTWFNIIWTGVFQYCFIRVAMTITAMITQFFNRYCLESLNPGFAHIWVMVIEALAVTIAMYCLIQFYLQLRTDIAEHKPLLKVLAIKLVIFLSFWQNIVISFLTSSGAINASPKLRTPDIKVGIPSLLLCIEMAIFAVFHLWAFSYKPYDMKSKAYRSEAVPGEEDLLEQYKGGPLGIMAILDAMNPWDVIKAVARAGKWLFRDRKFRENDSSYSISRVTTNINAFDEIQAEGRKDARPISNPTEYFRAGGRLSTPKTGQYPGAKDSSEENLNLLYGAQRPAAPRSEVSPYRSDHMGDNTLGNIGVAHSKDYAQPTVSNEDDEWNGSEYNSSRSQPPRYTTASEQTTGVMSNHPPYPESSSGPGRARPAPEILYDPPHSDNRRGRNPGYR